jgi:hypothetical protein
VHKELFKRNLKVQSLLGELRGEYHENLEIWKIIDTTLIVACSFLWFRFQSSTMVVVFCLLKSMSIGRFFAFLFVGYMNTAGSMPSITVN